MFYHKKLPKEGYELNLMVLRFSSPKTLARTKILEVKNEEKKAWFLKSTKEPESVEKKSLPQDIGYD